MYDTFSDHWLWVVVLYTLYLVVPLLKWHLHFNWHAIATEGLDMRGTKSQSHGQCVYEMPHIFIGLNRGWGWGDCPLGSHPLSGCAGAGGQGWTHPPLSERWPPSHPHQDTHVPQDFPKVLVVGLWGCIQLSEDDLPAEILHELLQLIIHKIPKVCLQSMQGPPTWVKVARG